MPSWPIPPLEVAFVICLVPDIYNIIDLVCMKALTVCFWLAQKFSYHWLKLSSRTNLTEKFFHPPLISSSFIFVFDVPQKSSLWYLLSCPPTSWLTIRHSSKVLSYSPIFSQVLCLLYILPNWIAHVVSFFIIFPLVMHPFGAATFSIKLWRFLSWLAISMSKIALAFSWMILSNCPEIKTIQYFLASPLPSWGEVVAYLQSLQGSSNHSNYQRPHQGYKLLYDLH